MSLFDNIPFLKREENPVPGTVQYAKNKEKIRDNWQLCMEMYKERIQNIEDVIAFLDSIDPRISFIDKLQEDIRFLKTHPDLREGDDFFKCPDINEEIKRIGHFLVLESGRLERTNKLSLEDRYRLNLLVDRIKGEYSDKVQVLSADRTIQPMDFIMAVMFIAILLVLMLVMDSDQYESAPVQGKLFIWSIVSMLLGSGALAMRSWLRSKF